jgi:hypothetical protein
LRHNQRKEFLLQRLFLRDKFRTTAPLIRSFENVETANSAHHQQKHSFEFHPFMNAQNFLSLLFHLGDTFLALGESARRGDRGSPVARDSFGADAGRLQIFAKRAARDGRLASKSISGLRTTVSGPSSAVVSDCDCSSSTEAETGAGDETGRGGR